jgi:hypothetical protein
MIDRMSLLHSLPASLDDIVRTNRHRFEVGLATEAEIAAVTGCVPSTGAAKGVIDDWRLVALRDRPARLVTLHVLGRFDSYAWMTSYVSVLSADRARVRTKNSLYGLGRPGAGEPELPLLLHVAHTLKRWGFDEHYGLGVLDVFY